MWLLTDEEIAEVLGILPACTGESAHDLPTHKRAAELIVRAQLRKIVEEFESNRWDMRGLISFLRSDLLAESYQQLRKEAGMDG